MILSHRLVRTGALIEETRVLLSEWDCGQSVRENLAHARRKNRIGIRSEGLAKVVFSTLHRRLSLLSPSELASLSALARSSAESEVWRAGLHWHSARVDCLYYEFVTDWLYQQYLRDIAVVRTEDVVPHVERVYAEQMGEVTLSEYGRQRAARDLLRMATDFGLLTATSPKQFTSFHLPDTAFLYILHNMAELGRTANQIVTSRDWRLFLMDAKDVERELFRLHQLRALRYEVIGTVRELALPYATAVEFVAEGVR